MSMRYAAGFISAFYNPLKNPNSPTIGTASASVGSISVAFTAPSNVGGSSITGYTVQATKTSDGSITYTSGTSSPISVTGLSATAYTFKVLATNSYGSSFFSAASNSATPLVIGDSYGGGYLAGQISTTGNGVATHNLVVGPVASAQNLSKQFKILNTDDPGATSVIDGPSNSSSMNDVSHPAAQFCEGLTIGGFSDWYMPAKNELEVCYYNLKPTTAANDPAGINANAVPARASNYTSGTPAQTSATNFRDTGAEDFVDSFYWASTQLSSSAGWIQAFSSGYQGSYGGGAGKTTSSRVRAIRRVAV